MIDINKKYQTRDGRPARILATDMNHPAYPVVAIIPNKDGSETVQAYTKEGYYYKSAEECGYDLIEVPVEVVRFVSLYSPSCSHLSRESADRAAIPGRIALLKITTRGGKFISAEEVPL